MEDSQKSYSVSLSNKPLGELLVEAGLISIAQIELALQEQKQSDLRIGEILVSHGWIQQKTVDFLAERWLEMIQEQPKKPLVYYLQESGLLDTEQVNVVIRLHKLKFKKIQFHRLIVEQGYLKQNTLDFFLSHLFNIYDPNAISIAKSYDVLKNYVRGQKDFRGIDISKAPLMGISLKGITLDGSRLRKVDLSKANLSRSSLARVNLSLANFTKAILTRVNFTKSFLTRANFQVAHLEQANFKSAILHEVDFQSAYLAEANFSGADLKLAKLPLDYPYKVYYDQYTIFDHNFDPQLFGWINIGTNFNK